MGRDSLKAIPHNDFRFMKGLKKMRKIILIMILILGIMNAGMIKDYVRKELKRISKVEYCNDVYMGRPALLNECLNK